MIHVIYEGNTEYKNIENTEYKKCTGALQVAKRLSRYYYMPTRILTNPVLSISTI